MHTHVSGHCKHQTTVYVLLWVLLLASIGLFVLRGPMRGMENSTDFFLIYASAAAWYHGENPYDAEHIRPWINERHGETRIPQRSLNLLYPPMTYPLLIPLASQYWPSAKLTWMLTNLACFAGLLYLLTRMFHLHCHRIKLMCFLIIAFAYGPVHSAFSVGQVTLVVAFGLVLALWLLKQNKLIGGGICMGLFLAIKPHLVGLFILRPLFKRQGKALAGVIILPFLLLALGAIPLMYNGIDWLSEWQQNVATFEQQGEGSTRMDYSLRFQMIHADVILHVFTNNIDVLRMMVRALLLAACALSLWWWIKQPSKARDIASLGVLVTATLLFAYHRYYDATLLLIPLAGMIALANRKQGWAFYVAIVCFLAFIVPGNAMLGWWAMQAYIPASITETMLWNLALIPHLTWSLIIGTVCLLLWSWRSNEVASDHANCINNLECSPAHAVCSDAADVSSSDSTQA